MDGLQVAADSPKYATTSLLPDEHLRSPSHGKQVAVPNSQKATGNPFGLSPLAFGLLVGLATCVCTGAIVGGVVGGILGPGHGTNNGPASCAPTTFISTTTATAPANTATSPVSGLANNYIPLPPWNVNSTAFPYCPGQNGQNITSPSGIAFTLECYVNYSHDDLLPLVAYTIEDCMQACVNRNTEVGSIDCLGITYWAWMYASFNGSSEPSWGNCWLKQQLDDNYKTFDETQPHGAAILQ